MVSTDFAKPSINSSNFLTSRRGDVDVLLVEGGDKILLENGTDSILIETKDLVSTDFSKE